MSRAAPSSSEPALDRARRTLAAPPRPAAPALALLGAAALLAASGAGAAAAVIFGAGGIGPTGAPPSAVRLQAPAR